MVQGRGINSSINETGRQQAQLFYNSYKEVGFDKIYVSSLKRTKESVNQFIKDGISYEQLPGLDEISWGDHEGQHFDPEMHQKYLDCIERWAAGDLDVAVSGGETPKEVMARQKESIEHILSKNDEETILVCSHGRAMRILVCWLLNYPLHKMDVFKHRNLCLYELTYTGKMFSVDKANDIAHLNGSRG